MGRKKCAQIPLPKARSRGNVAAVDGQHKAPGMRSASYAVVGVLVAAGALIVLVRFLLPPAATAEGQSCGRAVPSVGRDLTEPGVLLPAPGQLVNFVWVYDKDESVHRFGSELRWQSTTGRPGSLSVGDRLAVSIPSELTNAAKNGSIPSDQISAVATVTSNGVELGVCIDTSGVEPDRYQGAVMFDDPEIQATPFTIDLVVTNRAEWIPLAAVIAGIALALMIVLLSVANSTSPRSVPTIVAVALVAFITMMVGTRPWAIWQNDPTWGKDRFDWITLAAATALAFLGGFATSDTVQNVIKAAGDKSDDNGAKGAP